MRKTFFLVAGLAILLLLACKDSNKSPIDPKILSQLQPIDSADPNMPLYPFIEYINGQLAHIDSTPFAIEKTITIDGKLIDSGYSNRDELKSLAKNFTAVDPNQSDLKPFYKETSFQDLTINRLTFSISASSDSLPLQQVDVLLNPENQSVKNVIIRKYLEFADSTKSQHLLWVDNRHFQISETINDKAGKTFTRVTRIVWDKPLQ